MGEAAITSAVLLIIYLGLEQGGEKQQAHPSALYLLRHLPESSASSTSFQNPNNHTSLLDCFEQKSNHLHIPATISATDLQRHIMGQIQFGSLKLDLQSPIQMGITESRFPRLDQPNGQMATMNKGRKLVCFYCNKKSNIVYDGLISEWTCRKCEATNYLDQVRRSLLPPV